MEDNTALLTLSNGTRVEAAMAFVYVQGLRALFEADREAFDLLHDLAEGLAPSSHSRAALGRLREQGILDGNSNEMLPDLKNVFLSAVKLSPEGGIEVGFPFDKDDDAQMALWSEQSFKQWRGLVSLRAASRSGADPTPPR